MTVFLYTATGPIASRHDDNAVALTKADGTHHEAESVFDPHSPEFWVYAGLTIFILLAIFVGKAPRRITDALDQRIADTRRQLDEAAAIRADAERLLAEAQRRHAASAGDAAAIVQHAEAEAQALLAKAETDAAELVERRGVMAQDKIAAAERQAVADASARAADAAARAAATLIARDLDAGADKALVDRSIAGLSRLN